MPAASLYPDLATLGAVLRNVAPGTVGALGVRWQRELDATVARWRGEVGPLREAALLAQVEVAVHAGHPASLTALHAPAGGGDALLAEAMRRMAAAGVESVLAEAATAGVDLDPPAPVATVTLAEWARAAADLLAAGLALGIGREALRRWRPGATATGVADGLREYLGGLSDRPLRDVIGGALTRAQNLGRLRVYTQPLPPAVTLQLVADETLDSNTCQPCRRIDGVVLPSPEAAMLAYGGAGYLFCQGGERCRGTVRGVWQRVEPPRDAVFGSLGAVLARHVRPDDTTTASAG